MPPTSSTYADPETLFTVQVPPGWALDTSGQSGARAILYHPEVWSGFRSNVNIVVQPLGALTSDEFLTLTRLQIKQLTGQQHPERDTPSTEPPGGWVIEYAANFGASAALRVRQDIHCSAGRVFVLTATAPDENFARCASAFHQILHSFRLPSS